MMQIPKTRKTAEISAGITIPVSNKVVINRPGGVLQADVKFIAVNIETARPQIVPIREKKPPISTLFIIYPPFWRYIELSKANLAIFYHK